MDDGFKWNNVSEGEKVTDTRYTITGLQEGYRYDFRVAAINRAGTGDYSKTREPVTLQEPIGEQN